MPIVETVISEEIVKFITDGQSATLSDEDSVFKDKKG